MSKFFQKNGKYIIVWSMILIFLGTLVPTAWLMFAGSAGQ